MLHKLKYYPSILLLMIETSESERELSLKVLSQLYCSLCWIITIFVTFVVFVVYLYSLLFDFFFFFFFYAGALLRLWDVRWLH